MTRNQIFAYVIGAIVALIAITNIFSDDDGFHAGVDGVRINVDMDDDDSKYSGRGGFTVIETPDGEIKCEPGQTSITYIHSDGSKTEISC